MTRVSKRAVGLAVVATVLNAEVDPGAVRATRQNFPSPSCFRRITRMQHLETASLPRATHV